MLKKIVLGGFVAVMIAAIVIGVVQLVAPAAEAQRRGEGRAVEEGSLAGRGNAGQGQGGQGQGGSLNATGEAQAEVEEWVTIEGTVLETAELVVETEAGEVVEVGLGPSHYREAQGFVLSEGDRVRVSAYWEDGEFKAGEVENLSTGETITLRDAHGRPRWAGQGNRRNAVSYDAQTQ